MASASAERTERSTVRDRVAGRARVAEAGVLGDHQRRRTAAGRGAEARPAGSPAPRRRHRRAVRRACERRPPAARRRRPRRPPRGRSRDRPAAGLVDAVLDENQRRARSGRAPARAPSRTSAAPSGSRLAVGSSSMSRPGCRASVPASASRCCSPPDSACVGRSRPYGNSTAASAASTRGQIDSVGTHRFSSPKATSSPARPMTICASGSWKSSPMRSRAARGSRPSTRRAPPTSAAAPRIDQARRARPAGSTCPAPDGPSSSTRSPGSIVRSRPRSAQSRRPGCRTPQPRASIRAGRATSASAHCRAVGASDLALFAPHLEVAQDAGGDEGPDQQPGADACDEPPLTMLATP